MSYGKYGMKHTGLNNMAGIAYNDPWFAAGMLLAQNWNKNYEDRGTKKAIDAKLAELSSTANAQEKQAAQTQWQSTQPVELTPMQQAGSNVLRDSVDQLSLVKDANGQTVLNKTPGAGLLSGIASAEPEKDLMERVKEDAMANSGVYGKGMLLQQQRGDITPTLEDLARKQLQDYSGRLSLDRVPAISAEGQVPRAVSVLNRSQGIGDIADVMAQQRLQNFDANTWVANAKLDLMKQGYSQEQIQAMMEPLAQKAAGMQQEQNQQKAQGIVDRYFDLTAAGNYKDAAKLVVEAMQYNPEVANYMAKEGVSMKDLWDLDVDTAKSMLRYRLGQQGADNNVGRNKELTQFNAKLRLDTEGMSRDQRYNYTVQSYIDAGATPQQARQAAAGLLGGGPRSNDSQVQARIAQSNKEMEWYNKWRENNPDAPDQDYPRIDAYRRASDIVDEHLGVPSLEFDKKDGKSWQELISRAKKQGYSDEQISDFIRANGGEMTDDLLADLGVKSSPAAQAKPEAATQVQQFPQAEEQGLFASMGDWWNNKYKNWWNNSEVAKRLPNSYLIQNSSLKNSPFMK